MANQKVRYLVKTWSTAEQLGPFETWLNEGAKNGARLFSVASYTEEGRQAKAVCIFEVPL